MISSNEIYIGTKESIKEHFSKIKTKKNKREAYLVWSGYVASLLINEIINLKDHDDLIKLLKNYGNFDRDNRLDPTTVVYLGVGEED